MSDGQDDQSRDDARLDPVYVTSLREAYWIVAAWAVNCLWVVGYCRLRGYDSVDVENLRTILGMPAWVFWGIFLPWIAATVFTIWFALKCIADHPLGGESETGEGAADRDPSGDDR